MGIHYGNRRHHSAPGFDLVLVRDPTADSTPALSDAAAVFVVMFALIMAVTLIQLWFNRHA
jgi:hypothetical protein